jgi:hypothetical protein
LPDRRTAVVPGLLVAAVLAGLWLGFDVSVGELARFVGYECVFIGLPGIAVYRALSRRPGGALRQVAIGWPLGYALEIGAFALTAALDLRALLPVIPLAATGVAAGYLWHARRRVEGEEDTPGEKAPAALPLPPAAVWAVAAVVTVALGYLALGYFTETPLPDEVASVSYYQDNVWDIELVAEAKNHWPMEDPSVAGEPLRYHTYAFIHMAAVSQVTGIEPSTLLFRLVPAWLMLLVGLQVVALGRALGGSVWTGPLAVALVLLVGELDLDPERPAPFADTFFVNFPLSPTFLFGVPLFLAIATLLLVALARREAPGLRGWMVVLILLLACGGAKASILPVVLGALVLWLAWAWLREDALPRAALVGLGVGVSAFAISYALLYTGGGAGGFSFEVFGFTDFTVIAELIEPATRSPLGDALLTGATGLLGAAALVLPTLGILWVIGKRRLRLEAEEAWLLALFLAALGAFFVLADPSLDQAYFLNYGYIAGCVLSARGILIFLERSRATWNRTGAVLGGLVASALLAGALAALIIYVPGADKAGLGHLALGYAIAALAIAALALRASRTALRRKATAGAGVALLLAISLGLLNTPLDNGVPVAEKLDADQPLYQADDPTVNRGLTRDLYDGLRWVRDHTEKDSVIAVNNHSLDAAGQHSVYFYYTAFAERRAFLESWQYTNASQEIGYERVGLGEELPFGHRRKLNAAAFDRASPEALEKMRTEYGVDYLLVDKLHGGASPKLRRLGDPTFENGALAVYRLGPASLLRGASG